MPHHHDGHDPEALRKALLEGLDEIRTGMLGLEGHSAHMQPMTHFLDEKTRVLRFITARDTDLARRVGSAARARYTVADKGNLYACITGDIAPSHNSDKLDELWSPAASMWFEGGREDPSVLLLEMRLEEAAVWTVEANALQFGIELIRANTGDHTADLGDHGVIRLAT